MSLFKMATLCRNCLDDLTKLKELYFEDVLSKEEFTEENFSHLAKSEVKL